MMAKDQDPSATEFCSNCKRDIPSVNYLMHQNHCSRNIVLCSKCEEPVPRTEMDQHNEENHVKVTCKCGEAVEKCQQEEHDAEHCPQRQVTCEYCEMGMDFKNHAEHKDFCGSRTEPCPKCSRYIYFRDKVRHEATDCKYPEVKPVKPNPFQSTAAVRDPYLQNDLLFRSAKSNRLPSGLLGQFTGPPLLRPGTKGYPSGLGAGEGRRGLFDGGFGDRKQRKNQDRVQNVMTRNPARGREKNEERALLQSATSQEELDHRLAQHLAQDLPDDSWYDSDDLSEDVAHPSSGPPPAYDEFQDDIAIQELIKDSYSIPAINTFQEQGTALGDLTLPCEFCQRPIPAETLIQHQSGCRPDLACHPKEETAQTNNSRPRGPSHPQPPSEVLNNFNYGSTFPGYSSLDRSDSPHNYDEDNLLMLPCEFCEILLPADALPMHQVNCSENRTVTPAPTTFDPSPGSYPTRRGGSNESPIRPKPHRVQRPQDFPVRPRKHQDEQAFADPSIDDDDIDVDAIPAPVPKPRNPPQPKSRHPRNTVPLAPQFPSDASQQGTGQQPSFARSTSEKYLHGTSRNPRPTATVSSMPSGGAVRETKIKNTAASGQSRYREERPQSKSSARVQETLQGLQDAPPDDYSEEGLKKLLGTKLLTGPDGETYAYTQVKYNPFSKPKTTNFPQPSGLEMDDHPSALLPQFNPAVAQDRPPPHQHQSSGARQKVRHDRHQHKDGNRGNGGAYHPSFPNAANPRKGGDSERRGNSGGTRRPKQPSASTTVTLDPDGLVSPLRVKEEPNTHRTSNQKQGQRRRTPAQRNTRLREDPVL
ncbi:TRAF-type zinc finger domain-containing protein 1-like [Patiria miniata]|uniref:TRAF-type domain-containing protein n=1 Tax=Patiria miniata TaxID=46514 RepID=A0A914A7Q9_PATMI|nr:TRAF-type zinc finger domain-containing protein 1-like [Patiria miniata]XP_038059897.1 TRAF-type zinc finger domain-containing protein 1-like [Patiria miniata]